MKAFGRVKSRAGQPFQKVRFAAGRGYNLETLNYIRRAVSWLMITLLMLQSPVTALAGQEERDPDVREDGVICYQGAPVEDGAGIPLNARLTFRLQVGFEDLVTYAGGEYTFPLPDYLAADMDADRPFKVSDGNGHTYRVGTVTARDGKTLGLDFLSARPSSGTVPPATAGNATASGATAREASSFEAEEDPDEDPEIERDGEIVNDLSGRDAWFPAVFGDETTLYTGVLEWSCHLNQELAKAGEELTVESGGEEKTLKILPPPMMLLDAAAPHNMKEFQTGAALYKGVDVENGQQVHTGDEVSWSDRLVIQYLFEIPTEKGRLIQAGDEYDVTLPDGLKWSDVTKEEPLHLKEGNVTGAQFGTLHMTPGRVYVTFVSDFASSIEMVENAWLEVSCWLDQADIGDAEKYKIKISDSTELEITIAENKPVLSKLEKTVSEYTDNRLTWTVKYIPGKKEPIPEYIIDEFDSGMQLYVPGTLTVTDSGGTNVPSSAGDSLVDTSTVPGKTRIVFPLTGDLKSKSLTMTYQTRLSDEAVKAAGNTKAENSAWLGDGSKAEIDGTKVLKSQTVSGGKKTWITKNGSDSGKTINWTITINTNDRDLENLVLMDDIPDGLMLKTDSVTITPGGSLSVTEGPTAVTGAARYKFAIPEKSGAGSGYAQSYTIKYTTVVADKYFENPLDNPVPSGGFKNKAWLEYTWKAYAGAGGTIDHTPPTADKGVGINNNIIQKEGAGYDTKTHTLTWKVVVNPYKVNIQSATMSDALDKAGYEQTYVAGSFETLNPSLSGDEIKLLPSPDSTDKNLMFKVGNIGTETVEFWFQTTVDNPEDYAYNLGSSNHTKNYKNWIEIDAQVLESGAVSGVDPVSIHSSDDATQTITSEVLKKESLSYDYTDNTIKWKVTVNQNKMPMESAVLEDTLAEGLSLVPDSVIPAPNASGKLKDCEYDSSSRKITFTLADPLNEQVEIQYKTKIDVDNLEAFTKDTAITFGNKVILKRGQGLHEEEHETSQELENHLVAKSGGVSSSDSYVLNYAVKINPHGIEMEGTATDTFGEGLQLDPESVKLYKANVDANGTFTKNGSAIAWGNGYTFENRPSSRSFSVTFPSGSDRYVLEYSMDILDRTKAPFKNKISLEGYQEGGAGNGDSSIGGGGGGGGGGTSSRGSITIEKTDALRPSNPVEGAVFQLFMRSTDGSDDLLVGEQRTDADGKAVFGGLKVGRDYYLLEIQAAEGYVAAQGEIAVDSPTRVNKNVTKQLTNDPVTGSLVFRKQNDWNHPLAGAKFRATDMTANSTIVRDAVSGPDGVVRFEDLPFGTYEVGEIETPQHHTGSGEVFTAEIDKQGACLGLKDSSGQIVSQVVNTADKGARIEITKTDEETGNVMPGVTFTLYDSYGIVVGSQETDADGKAVFLNLKLYETYTIHETTPPGYQDSPDRTVSVDGAGVYEISWLNKPEDKPAPPPDPPSVPPSGGSNGGNGVSPGGGGGGNSPGNPGPSNPSGGPGVPAPQPPDPTEPNAPPPAPVPPNPVPPAPVSPAPEPRPGTTRIRNENVPRARVDTAGKNKQEILKLLDDGYVPLANIPPNLTNEQKVQWILDNKVPLYAPLPKTGQPVSAAAALFLLTMGMLLACGTARGRPYGIRSRPQPRRRC